MHIDIISVGQMQANCYVVSNQNRNAILIDPGDEYSKIASFLKKQKITPKFIAHTHGHIDHIGCDNEFGLPIYIHKLDIELLKNPEKNLSSFLMLPFRVNKNIKAVEDLDCITLDELRLEVIHTPGHTPGGICLKAEKVIFTGDTLFSGSIGRTDFVGASGEQLIKSIQSRLLIFPDNTIIYPGHGEPSTIGKEKNTNPFLCKN